MNRPRDLHRTGKSICLAVFILLPIGCSRTPPGREIRWTSGDIELEGTLVLPDGEGPYPLAVFVAGSGTVPRSLPVVREHARQLSARGVGVFIYDKRGSGQSGGDWKTVGLTELADDVLAVLPQLVSDPRVDASRVGLIGLSQGAWVSLLVAERSEQVAFVVWLSGPPMTPAEQGHAIVELRMREKGWDEQSIARALELDRMVAQVYRTDEGWDNARAALKEASAERWWKDAGVGIQPRDSWNWRWYASLMDYDPMPALHELEIPILAVYGQQDMLVPAERSRKIIEGLGPEAQGPRSTVLMKGVAHELRRDKHSDWPPEYWDALVTWFREQKLLK